jgi:hypothetical protein
MQHIKSGLDQRLAMAGKSTAEAQSVKEPPDPSGPPSKTKGDAAAKEIQ